MSVREYVGARYVPIIVGEWDKTQTYEPLMVVTYQGASYTSRQYVPAGIEITNEKFWALTGNYNAQVEQYRKEVADYKTLADTTEEHLATIYPLDTTPTDGSTKGVTSDGINDAIGTVDSKIDSVNNKVDTIYPLDTAPTDGSIKGITSGGVYSSLYNCEKIYSTVEELKKAKAHAGEIVATMSYYANDNGGAIYNISDTQNGLLNLTSIKLDNGLFANMHVSPYMHAESIGCKSNVATFDNSTILNEFWQQYKNHGLIFDSGDYYFANTLSTNGPMYFNVNTHLHLNSENIIDVAVKINPDLTLGDLATSANSMYDESMCKIKCDRKANTGIEVYTGNSNTFTFVVYNAIKIGVHTRPTTVKSKFDVGCYYNVAVITDRSGAATEIGVQCNSSDCIFTNISPVNCMTGVVINGSDNIFQMIHPWLSTSNFWSGSVCVNAQSGFNKIETLCNDTMETSVAMSQTVVTSLIINDLLVLMNTNIVAESMLTSYMLTDFDDASDDVIKSSQLYIKKYYNYANVPILKIGSTGKLPFRCEINLADYKNSLWDYDLNYLPAGTFLINLSHSIAHKPTNFTAGRGTITCFKTGYTATQIITRGPSDYVGENHLDYPTSDKWTTAPIPLTVRYYDPYAPSSMWYYLAAYGQSGLSNS